MRVTIRVRPAASSTVVGGSFGPALVVRVTASAVEGRATDAALRALAEAFSVRPSAVSLVHGARSRTKAVEVVGDDVALARRLAELLGAQ